MQLRRAAGDVEGGNVARLEKPEARVHDFRRHDLGAIRAGIHVAMVAGLVAPLADVHLKHRDAGRSQGIVAAEAAAVSNVLASGSAANVARWAAVSASGCRALSKVIRPI